MTTITGDDRVALAPSGKFHILGRAARAGGGPPIWSPITECGQNVHGAYSEIQLKFLDTRMTSPCKLCFKHVDIERGER